MFPYQIESQSHTEEHHHNVTSYTVQEMVSLLIHLYLLPICITVKALYKAPL